MLKRLLILSFSLIAAVSTVHAEQKSIYSTDRITGWYGYERYPEKAKKPAKKERLSLKRYTYSQLWNMPVPEFKKLTKKFLNRAVQDPSEENVYEYLVLQDIARRKAAAFAGTFTLVTQKHPELTMRDVYPIAVPGRRALHSMEDEDVSRTIASSRNDFALVVFVRQGCRFCAAQEGILSLFLSRYNWPIKQTDISSDPAGANLAARMGITRVPAIVVVYRKTGKFMPVSVGVIAEDDLERRLYNAIQYLSGRRKPQQFFLYDFQKGSGADPLANLEKARGGDKH